jgi:hypothetical protein
MRRNDWLAGHKKHFRSVVTYRPDSAKAGKNPALAAAV